MKNYTVFFSVICLICIAILLITSIFRPMDKTVGSDGDSGRIDECVGEEEGDTVPADESMAVSGGYEGEPAAASDGEAVSEDGSLYVCYNYASWLEWDVPKHSQDDIQSLLSYEDNGWRKAYAEVLLEYESAEEFNPQSSRWDLYDLDDSGVPELVYMPFTSGGGRREYIVYTYADGAVEMLMDVATDVIAYCPEEDLICWEKLMQGEYYNVILKLENDDIAERHVFYTNDGAVDEADAVYTLDDKNVTRDEFYNLLRSPESGDEEEKWKYIRVRFVVGEYDDIFFMGIYPNLDVE